VSAYTCEMTLQELAPVVVDTSRLGLLVQLGFSPEDVMRHAGLPLELLAQRMRPGKDAWRVKVRVADYRRSHVWT
jgi:hypothetical protein